MTFRLWRCFFHESFPKWWSWFQGFGRILTEKSFTITRLVGNNRVYRWYGCWLVITYQERGLLNHTPTWHEGPPSVRWLRSYIWSLPHGGWAGGWFWFWFATTGYDPKMDEQGVFIHCTHKSRMAGGRWLGGLYDTYPMPGLLITWQRVILSSEDENLYRRRWWATGRAANPALEMWKASNLSQQI